MITLQDKILDELQSGYAAYKSIHNFHPPLSYNQYISHMEEFVIHYLIHQINNMEY